MSEWKETTWGEITTLEYGKGLRNYQDSAGKVPVYGTNGKIGYTDQVLCPFPGVIIGRKGAYRGVHYSKVPFFVIDTAFYLKPKNESEIDLKFAYYKLLTQDINALDSGSAIPSTSREDFYSLDLLLPPLKEQCRIAAVLSSLDNKIDLLRRQNETLEQIAQTLFKRWFVEFEFPFEMAQDRFSDSVQGELFDFTQGRLTEAGKPYKSSGGEMVSSELGEIPAGWRKMPLYEIATYINGAAFKLDDFSEDNSGLPIIKIAEMKYGITSQTKYTTNKMEDKYYIDDGEILFSWSGSPETSINIFLWSLGRGILNQHTFRVLPSSDEERVWLFYLLKSLKPLFIHIAKQKQTTGLGHVTRADLQEMLVSAPDHLTIKKFDDVVRPIFTKYFNNEKQIQTLTRLRDTLLPKLMSGKIRV